LCNQLSAQVSSGSINNANSKKTISAEFNKSDVEYKDIAVMTNVLKIKNNNGKNYTFNITLNIPSGWRTLNNPDREYTLKPNDSVFVPIRLITSDKKTKGGTKYNIAAYVNTNEGKQMAYARFMAGRAKVTNWQMQVLPRPRIYLLNGENVADFQVNLVNDGDEPQEVLVSMQKMGKDFVVKDSLGNILKKNYIETTLQPYSDTTMSFKVHILEQVRNDKRIDTWGYNPTHIGLEKRYGLFLRGSEVRFDKHTGARKGKKVDFVKLANNIDFVKLQNSTVTGTGSNVLPLTIFVNINNMLGQQPIMLLNFIGNSQVGRYSSLNYQLQTGFMYYKYSNEFLKNRLMGNLIYNYKRAFIGIGSFGYGKGLMAGYNFDRHNVSVFFARDRFLGLSEISNFGLRYGCNSRFFNFNIASNLSTRLSLLSGVNIFSNITFRLGKKTIFGIFSSFNQSKTTINQENISKNLGVNVAKNFNRYNINLFSNYTLLQYKQPLRTINFNNYSFGIVNNYLFRSGRSLSLNNTYMINSTTSLLPNDSSGSVIITNNLVFGPKPKMRKVTITPMLFFNYNRLLIDTLVTGGAQFNLSHNNYENNFFLGSTLRLAYNELLNAKDLGIFFNTQANLFARYKVWNIMTTYNYGPVGAGNFSYLLRNNQVYNQSLRISLGHQHQFKNKHYVFENNFSYNYVNTSKRHSFSLFSQFFYFTDNGYRFSLNANFNIVSSIVYKYKFTGNTGASQNYSIEESDKRSINESFALGATIKKDFGIPIPKRLRNNKFCDAKFVVFLDVNGNGIMDEGEVPVENVVLRMNDFEVITDESGHGSFINMAFSKYKLQVFPLVDMGSWFPNVNDSMDVCGPDLMYIPFSKGVQVMGGIELDRESFTGEIFQKLDVSRFKIYLIDTTGKTHTSITDSRGNYSFYVPYAKYTLRFDEKALGSSFYVAENEIKLDLTSGIESYYHNFLIIERKRKVKRKIFGSDGKITYVEETAGSSKNGKDANSNESESDTQLANQKDGKNTDNLAANGKDGKDGKQTISVEAKMDKLDSLINVLNQLILRAATRIEVRTIVKQEMQDLIDELNASFTIKLEELPKFKNPTGLLLQLVRLKKVVETKLPNGNKVYTSGDYRNVSDAEKFCRDYQTSGFKNARVVKKTSLMKK